MTVTSTTQRGPEWLAADGVAQFFLPGSSRQVSTITCVGDVGGSLNETYIHIYAAGDAVHYIAWFDVDESGFAPSIPGTTNVQVSLTSDSDAATVAAALSTALANTGAFTTSVHNAKITVTNINCGASTNASNGGLSPHFTFSTTSIGTDVNLTGNGVPGEIRYDSNFLYACISTNIWLRVALSANGGSGSFPGGVQGSVLFMGASSAISQNNTSFFWDDSANLLKLSAVASQATELQTWNTSDGFQVVGILPYGTMNLNGGKLQFGSIGDPTPGPSIEFTGIDFRLTGASTMPVTVQAPDHSTNALLVFGPSNQQSTPIVRVTSPVSGINVSPEWGIYQSGTTTSSATPANLFAYPTSRDTIYYLSVRVAARRLTGSGSNGDSAIYQRVVKAKNVAGTLTLGAITSVVTSEDVAAWDCTFTTSGTTVVVQVTGAASTTVLWHLVEFLVSPVST